jgi:hypothetical protein
MTERPTKITFAEMRDMGVRGVRIYCPDYKCSHSIAVSADQWAFRISSRSLCAQYVAIAALT